MVHFMGGIGSGRRFQNRRGPRLEEVPQLDKELDWKKLE